MNFKEAYQKMREGKKVKRKGRSMCCVYDSKAGRICTGDCSTRALVGCLGLKYDDVLDLQLKFVKKYYYDFTSRQCVEKILSDFGYVKMKQPKKPDGTKYRVNEIDKILSKEELMGGVIINTRKHYVCCRDDYYQDIWDSGLQIVGNYYIKK